MSRLFYIIGAIIAAISIVQAQLSKPALRNSLDAFWPQLQKKLRNPGYRIKQWPRGIIAQGCKDLAGRENLDPDVITTYEVLYGDVRCLFFFSFFFSSSFNSMMYPFFWGRNTVLGEKETKKKF